jgi:hypothetical protein
MKTAMAIVLLLLTRDGVLHTLADGPDKGTNLHLEKPTAMARLGDGKLVVLHAKGLTVVDGPKQHAVPGKNDDLKELIAVGARLCATDGADEVVDIDLKTGKRKLLAKFSKLGFLAADGDTLYASHDKSIDQVGADPPVSWTLPAHPIVLAAAAGNVFAATHEGPLYLIERATGRQRDLGMGGWFNTLALAADAAHLYAVTTSGKVWEIDFAQSKKNALAIDGWQMAIALVISR